MLVLGGEMIEAALRSQRMSTDDVEESARAQGISDLRDVEVAILETDGKLSFVTYDRRRPPPSDGRLSE